MSDISPSSQNDPNVRPAMRTLRTSRGRWRALAFIALALAVIALVGRFAVWQKGEQDQVARIVISGVITTDAARLRELTRIAGDDHIKAVLVEINSPGGSTAGGEELYEALTAIRAKKPVVVTIAELGASAAYMTAVAADRIFARRLSLVGSIGVLMQHVDAQKLLDTIGLDLQKVQTGPLKAEPDLNDPLAGPVRQSFQGLVDDSFHWFVKIVGERRGLTEQQVLPLADGRILTGQMAKADKLIDAFGGVPEARNWLETDEGISKDLPVVTYYPFPKTGFEAWLQSSGMGFLGGIAKGFGLNAGLGAASANALDGLVSLWHAD